MHDERHDLLVPTGTAKPGRGLGRSHPRPVIRLSGASHPGRPFQASGAVNMSIRARGWMWAPVVAMLGGLPLKVSAIPLYARQTSQPCASCHAGFPELTPFGRAF